MSETALRHIEHLSAAIGPRGSTTPKEKEAHDYVHKVLDELGCAPRVETFQAATSTYAPFILGLGLMLVAEALFWLIGSTPNASAGALAAAALGALATASLLLELWPADNPLRWFPPVAPSQNVIGVTPPASDPRRKVLVMAHVDTHRTPFFWRSPGTFKAYRVLTPLAILSLVALCVIFVVGVFSPGEGLRTASLLPTGVVGLTLLMVLQAHFTPFTPGANDNASGVGVMLALAERLKEQPLKNTEVWWVATGCEELASPYGSGNFTQRHAAELREAALIVVDNIAGKDTGPVYLTREGIFMPLTHSPDLAALAEQIGRDCPELGVRATALGGAYTDAVHPLRAGMKTLSLVGFTRDGWIPNWHNPSDVFAHVDADAVERTEQFVWEMLARLDG